MEGFMEFWKQYGAMIMHTVFTVVAGCAGVIAKNLYKKFVNDKTKQDVIRTCVQAVEQIYKDLHGEAKLDKVLSSATMILKEKGIAISDVELHMMVESAVGEFNRTFGKPGETVAAQAPNVGAPLQVCVSIPGADPSAPGKRMTYVCTPVGDMPAAPSAEK